MDASVSPTNGNVDNNVCDYYIQIGNAYPTTVKQTSTVTKYTKLPAYDFDARATWHQTSYTLPPRLRRIISFDDQDMKTTRSLKYELGAQQRMLSSNYTKRKIITITEADENDAQPKLSTRDVKRTTSRSRAVATDSNQELERRKTIGRLTSSKYSRNTTQSTKTQDLKINVDNINRNNKLADTKDVNPKKKVYNRKPLNIHTQNQTAQKSKDNFRSVNENGTLRKNKILISNKIGLSKTSIAPAHENESGLNLIKNKLAECSKSSIMAKKPTPNFRLNNQLSAMSKESLVNKIRNSSKPVNVIHVPLEHVEHPKNALDDMNADITKITLPLVDCGTEIELIINSADASVGADLERQKVDKITEMDKLDFESYCNSETQTDIFKELDSLYVPNVTLTKTKNVKFCTQSLPNLQVPTNSLEEENYDKIVGDKPSYIIGRATLTYTTRQKIDFHVVGNKGKPTSNLSSSPLGYPINVVSVFRKKFKNEDLSDVAPESSTHNENDKSNLEKSDGIHAKRLLSCPNFSGNHKLMKPSDIISTIRVNTSLLQSEQFQRELNFIDSFFESLQYLESCSLSDQYFTDNKLKNWVTKSRFDAKSPEYDNIFSKLENGEENKNTETMTSKSLCLLNLLIRDEQRRAKNLLFVLKMREDALKDFTKSQILWLENKKKQDSTDISALKKKQRGALLKLQHECGEMQRMRKALLALSEKRKEALMKTKKNIEHQLRSDVSIDKIVLGKKKLKRNVPADRNIAPLKCFDLSSSGCEESTTSWPKSDTVLSALKVSAVTDSAENCIQPISSTPGIDSVQHSGVQPSDPSGENFVAVDGSYLNILFQNMSLPQIFSGGKQYEVNEDALKNIVSSTNIHHSDSDVVEKFMEQIKNYDLDKSSTPSTARSLVEEFDQYYKDLIEEENSFINSPDRNSESTQLVDNVKSVEAEVDQFDNSYKKELSGVNTETVAYKSINISEIDNSCVCEGASVTVETRYKVEDEADPAPTSAVQLPVLAEDTTELETTTDPLISVASKSGPASIAPVITDTASNAPPGNVITSLKSPVHCEAEELRRQQLAIEREIKALEQQQCQLLVVREIPDKPPPPYTPPTDARAQKPVRMFVVDDSIELQIYKNISDPGSIAAIEPFELFVQEFCRETVERHKEMQSEQPWDASCLVPWQPQTEDGQLVRKASADLKEVLTTASPAVSSGVGARRSDHIDDILFAEWRRCEPEWTALHADEAIVKNQLFDSIFQKILTETIDEYKKNVPCITPHD